MLLLLLMLMLLLLMEGLLLLVMVGFAVGVDGDVAEIDDDYVEAVG